MNINLALERRISMRSTKADLIQRGVLLPEKSPNSQNSQNSQNLNSTDSNANGIYFVLCFKHLFIVKLFLFN